MKFNEKFAWGGNKKISKKFLLSRIHICTRMPNEACGNEKNVDVDV